MSLRHIAELVGVAAFASSGVLRAGQKGMDLIGVAAIAFVTALGGGTLRDLLLDRHPVSWIAEPLLLWICLGATVLTLIWVSRWTPPHRALLITDALGLALFTIGGAQIAESVGQTGIVMVLMGILTGTAGGVVRDVLCAEIPMVLRPGQLYVTASAVGAALYLILQIMGADRAVAGVSGMGVIAVLRLIAMRWDVWAPVPRVAPFE